MNLLPSIAMDITKSPPTQAVLAEARRMLAMRRKQVFAAAALLVSSMLAVTVWMAWHARLEWTTLGICIVLGGMVFRAGRDDFSFACACTITGTILCVWWTGSVLGFLYVGLLPVLLLGMLLDTLIDERIQSLCDIAPERCLIVLPWCQQSTEVAAYQAAVAQQGRVLVKAEYEALARWMAGGEERALAARAQEAFEVLRAPVTRGIQGGSS